MTLMEHLPLPVTGAGRDRSAAWRDLGAAAARLNAVRGCQVSFAVSVDRAVGALATRATDTPFERGVSGLLDRLGPLGVVGASGLIHGEVNLSNAGRRASGEIALLDWDEAGVGPLALEYGYPLITAFVSEVLDVDQRSARSFYGAYAAAGGGVDCDLVFTAALFHALRSMWFGDVERRWERIRYALEHEDHLTALTASRQ